MSHDVQLEDQLKACQSLLKGLETRQAAQAARWEHTLAFTPDEKKPGLVEMINKTKARNQHEKNVLTQKIRDIKAQIATQAEEARDRQEKRAWLEAAKAQARGSWLERGGTEASFESSWPEMERQILMQDTLELLAVQPEPKPAESSTQQPVRKNRIATRKWPKSKWDRNLKPPVDPKKKRTG